MTSVQGGLLFSALWMGATAYGRTETNRFDSVLFRTIGAVYLFLALFFFIQAAVSA